MAPMRIHYVTLLVLSILCGGLAMGQSQGRQNRGLGRQNTDSWFNDKVPAHPLDIVLGRPTRDSVTVSVLTYQDTEGMIDFGAETGHLTGQTPTRVFKSGEPVEVVINSLKPDTSYFLQFHSQSVTSKEGFFHTQRPDRATFTFTITADSHLDDRVIAALYQRALANIVSDRPDFNIDLGDTFMTDKHNDRAGAAGQYVAQRYYFGQLGLPLFLVLGNHDGENPRGSSGELLSTAIWSNTMRKKYFANPVPDSFYSGNVTKHPQAGLLQDYYAWEWGDALFVALDPFWFSFRTHGKDDNWSRSLGMEQYLWLMRTLEKSSAKYKLIFIHHLVGGGTPEGRGGAEAAPLYEWGGKNTDGTDGFAKYRPGWTAPVHDLLVRYGVTAVFHGHDHLYVKQDLDGIVYQEVPQPGTPSYDRTRTAAEYGYKSGVVLGSPGHLRVKVSPTAVQVEYVRACLPADEQANRHNAQIVHSYMIAAKHLPAGPSSKPTGNK
jgi:hypothetical protein